MDYKELIDVLKEKFEITQIRFGDDTPKIKDILLLSSNLSQWQDDVLYIGSLSGIQATPNTPIMVISCDDPSTLPEGSNYSVIRSEDFYPLFNMTKDLIFEELKSEVILLELTQEIMNGRSIISAINTAARLLGNALILTDSTMNVLAYSTIYEIADPIWEENIKRGYYSYEFIKQVKSTKEMQEWNKHGKETQVIMLPGDKQPKLVARITNEGHLTGGLVMIEHHTPLKHCHFRQLPLVGKILLNAFKHESVGKVKTSLFSTILYNLLDEGNIADTLELINMSQVDFPQEMRVVVARFIQRIENRYLKRTIQVELERIFPNGHSAQYKSYIAILVPSISVDQKLKLNELAQNEDVALGISWSFCDIVEFKNYFNQAVSSIKQAQRFNHSNRIFDYTDYSYYDMLFNYTGKIPLTEYCHPSLQKLREYDLANNTQLYVTLRIYLECNKNIRDTADALFLHKNSLIYRVNRINQIIELDLNDFNTIYSLMDSFRIEAFLECYNKD